MALLSPLFPRSPIDVGQWLKMLPPDQSVPAMFGWKWLHSPGHISLWRESDRTLIAGDAIVTTGQESIYEVITQTPEMHGPPRYFTLDWEEAQQSVAMLARLEPELVITGHGQPVRGEHMRARLHELAANFSVIAVPEGRPYALDPAIAATTPTGKINSLTSMAKVKSLSLNQRQLEPPQTRPSRSVPLCADTAGRATARSADTLCRRSVGTQQRHQHWTKGKFALFGTPCEIAQVPSSRADVPSPFQDTGHYGGGVFRSHDRARILIGRRADAEHRANDNRRRHQVSPIAYGPTRSIVGNLRAGLQDQAQRERFQAGMLSRLAPFPQQVRFILMPTLRFNLSADCNLGFCALLRFEAWFRFSNDFGV